MTAGTATEGTLISLPDVLWCLQSGPWLPHILQTTSVPQIPGKGVPLERWKIWSTKKPGDYSQKVCSRNRYSTFDWFFHYVIFFCWHTATSCWFTNIYECVLHENSTFKVCLEHILVLRHGCSLGCYNIKNAMDFSTSHLTCEQLPEPKSSPSNY